MSYAIRKKREKPWPEDGPIWLKHPTSFVGDIISIAAGREELEGLIVKSFDGAKAQPTMSNILLQSAVDQLSMIASRKISPLELAEEHITQVERLNPKLNAFVDFDAERVRQQARALEQASGKTGPLHGLPMTVKASISVSGHRCETGSLLNQGHIPAADAVVVRGCVRRARLSSE